MNRIAKTLQALKSANKKAVVPYIVAGDPDLDTTLATLHALVDAGADIIELGVPFSDPMAEGPVIQLAHERALENNASLADVLELVARFRETNQDTPMVLMGYANPVEAMGYQAFADRASAAGVDGILTVDMPPEEAGELQAILAQRQIDIIYLIAPTTTEARMAKIAASATGYLYYVSVKGVTGAGNLDVAEVADKVAKIRELTDLPICVGFGIKDGESAKQISACADGAVIGSVLVSRMADCGKAGIETAASETAAIISEIRNAVDSQ